MIKDMYNSLKYIRKIYKMSKSKSITNLYEQNSIEVNWIGEPYYIKKIPNEFMESEITLNSFTWKVIEDKSSIFVNLGIDHLLYPVITVDRLNNVLLVELVVKKYFKQFFKITFLILILLGLILLGVMFIYK